MPYDLYPAVDETYNFAPEVRVALSKSLELRNDVEPMTTVLRNNLTASEKWDGRVIANTDTDYLERWDAGTSQWVPILHQADVNTSLANYVPIAQDKGVRNTIRNGDMRIAQRGNGPFSGNGAGSLDGWVPYLGGGGALSVSRTNIGTTGIGSPLLTCAVSGQSATSDFAAIWQRIEDVNTLAGKSAILSFKARASAGSPKLYFRLQQAFGTGGSPSAAVYTAFGPITLSTTLTSYSVPVNVPSITGKVLGTNENHFLELFIWLSAGSGNSTAGGIGNQNATFYITEVQLEEGTVATSFERFSVQAQLAWCQRYFQRFGTNNPNIPPSTIGYHNFGDGRLATTTASGIKVNFFVPMRTPPSLAVSPTMSYFYLSDPQNVSRNVVSIAIDVVTAFAMQLGVTHDAAAVPSGVAALYQNGANPAYIDFSAEL